jgi:hypothetical protein
VKIYGSTRALGSWKIADALTLKESEIINSEWENEIPIEVQRSKNMDGLGSRDKTRKLNSSFSF